MKNNNYVIPETKISGTRLRACLLANSTDTTNRPRPNENIDGTPVGGEVDPTIGFD